MLVLLMMFSYESSVDDFLSVSNKTISQKHLSVSGFSFREIKALQQIEENEHVSIL